MMKQEALNGGFCNRCAGYFNNTWVCGVGLAVGDNVHCRLPDEAVERFKAEWGLAGQTRRSSSNKSFGDVDQMKKKRVRRKK